MTTTTTTRPKRRRGRKIAATASALIVIGAVVAWALTMITASIRGGVEVRSVNPDLEWSMIKYDRKNGQLSCSAEKDSQGRAVINISNAAPGEWCEVEFKPVTKGATNRKWRVQDVTYGTAADVTFSSDLCGKSVSEEPWMTPEKFRLTVADVPMGTYDASPEAALVVVPAEEFNASACPETIQ